MRPEKIPWLGDGRRWIRRRSMGAPRVRQGCHPRIAVKESPCHFALFVPARACRHSAPWLVALPDKSSPGHGSSAARHSIGMS